MILKLDLFYNYLWIIKELQALKTIFNAYTLHYRRTVKTNGQEKKKKEKKGLFLMVYNSNKLLPVDF